MPRKAKDEEVKKETVKGAKNKATTKKSTGTTKKVAEKKPVEANKKATTKKKIADAKVVNKKAGTKASTKKIDEKVVTKKEVIKTAAKKSSKKTSTKKTTNKKGVRKVATPVEYYDLPSVYDKTVVKILAQTPSCLFVYWEISSKDKSNLQKQYGDGFFQDTKPYLIITNETMNYSFEIEINDYANSWYVRIQDSNCKYSIKLIRKPINHEVSISDSSIYISSSNEMDIPNDHILFDKLGKTVFFKNVKTNVVNEKNISSISLINNIGRIYNIYDLYKEIYKDELNGDELGTKLSSSQFSSFFK